MEIIDLSIMIDKIMRFTLTLVVVMIDYTIFIVIVCMMRELINAKLQRTVGKP